MGLFGALGFTVGPFHCHDVHLGDTIPLQERAFKRMGAIDPKEANQCAILHLCLRLAWVSEGCGKRLPDFRNLILLAGDLRVGEFRTASAAIGRIGSSDYLERQIVTVAAHYRV